MEKNITWIFFGGNTRNTCSAPTMEKVVNKCGKHRCVGDGQISPWIKPFWAHSDSEHEVGGGRGGENLALAVASRKIRAEKHRE